MNILVTGAAGFIGSHLVDRLLTLGHDVAGLDNLSYGNLTNLSAALATGRFEFIHGDVREPADVDRSMAGMECCFHLAAFKIPRYSDALDTLLVNGLGSQVVLEACVRAGARVIVASTSDVYGMNPDQPFSEETSTSVIGPPMVRRWAYAVSKMFEEQLVFAYRERNGLQANVVRFFGGYGPRQNLTWWGGPQSVFIGKALANEPMEVHGDGLQTRSFTYIDDYIGGLVAILNAPHAEGHVFNLGTVEETTIIDLALTIWRLVRSNEPKVTFIPYSTFGRYQDVRRRVPDNTKIRTLLGFESKVKLVDGLRKTIAWQRKALGEGS